MHRADGLWNNSYNVTPEELFDLFGKFGAIRYVFLEGKEQTLDERDGPQTS